VAQFREPLSNKGKMVLELIFAAIDAGEEDDFQFPI